jgi:hypothetical protein
MTEETKETPMITIKDKTYNIEELSDKTKELLSLHEQAMQMAVGAKRQAAIHDLSVQSLVKMVEESVEEAVEAPQE